MKLIKQSTTYLVSINLFVFTFNIELACVTARLSIRVAVPLQFLYVVRNKHITYVYIQKYIN